MTTQEQWLPMPQAPDKYLVSNLGRVKSLARKVPMGYEHRGETWLQERILSPAFIKNATRVTVTVAPNKLSYVNLARLVYMLFVDAELTRKQVVRFHDKDNTNCSASNLYAISRAELLALNQREIR